MGLNLITRNEYKAYAGITSPNQDAEIDAIIPKVSQLVKTYCKQQLVDNYDEPKVEYTNGGDSCIYLKEHPVNQVMSVEISTNYGQSYTSLQEFVEWAYEPHNYAIRSLSSRGFDPLVNGYKITYTCGYDKIPDDLMLAVMDLVTYYRKNDGAIHSTKAPGTNAVQIEYIQTTTLPAHIRRILDLYVADYV